MELRYLTKHGVLKLAYGFYASFQLSHQMNPSYRSLIKIHHLGAEIFNKTCSFKVSIWILSLISIVSSNESLLQKSHENQSTGSRDIKQTMQF